MKAINDYFLQLLEKKKSKTEVDNKYMYTVYHFVVTMLYF